MPPTIFGQIRQCPSPEKTGVKLDQMFETTGAKGQRYYWVRVSTNYAEAMVPNPRFLVVEESEDSDETEREIPKYIMYREQSELGDLLPRGKLMGKSFARTAQVMPVLS